MDRAFEVMDVAREHRMCVSACLVVLWVYEKGRTSSSVLARVCGISPAALTGLSYRMERRGLVKCKRTDTVTGDKRKCFISLTEEGENVALALRLGLTEKPKQ